MFHNIALSGGGAHVMSFIGALRVYEERGVLRDVRAYTASSGGSFVGLMLALGFSTIEMEAFVRRLLAEDFAFTISLKNAWSVGKTYGLDDGEAIYKLVDAIFAARDMSPRTTFLDLAKEQGRNLIIAVSNVNKERVEYLSVDNVPDMPVRTAVRMTTSVPIIYQPVVHEGEYYVDAVFYDNFPIRYFAEEGANTLGLRVVYRCERIRTVWDFFHKLVTGCIEAQGATNRASVCDIDCADFPNFDVTHMRFAFDAHMLDKMMEVGYDAAAIAYPKMHIPIAQDATHA